MKNVECEIHRRIEMLIYWSKDNLDVKVSIDDITHHLDTERRKCWEEVYMGGRGKIPRSIPLIYLHAIEISMQYLKPTIVLDKNFKNE